MDGGGSGAWGMGDVGFRLAWGGSLIAAPEKIRFNVTKWPEKNAIMLFVVCVLLGVMCTCIRILL